MTIQNFEMIIANEFYHHYLLCVHQVLKNDPEYIAEKQRECEERELRRIDARIRENSRYNRRRR